MLPLNESTRTLLQKIARLGRNDPCWCGSQKKFKKCHLNRHAQQSLGKQEILERFHSLYEEGNCLHPEAGPIICEGKIIKAHTIQRNGGLNRIARDGHVYSLLKDGRMFDESRWEPASGPNRIGVRQASTFTGFCSRHDNDLFAPLEKVPFDGSPLQVTLLGYRAICYELYMKERELAGSELRRESDREQPILAQVAMWEAHSIFESGVRKAIEELEVLKRLYDQVLFEERFDYFDYYVVQFGQSPEIMCNAIGQATHDFHGRRIHKLGNLTIRSNSLAFSLCATDEGGAAIFSWPTDHEKSRDAIRTLHQLPDAALPHAIIRFMFEFFENTYFSPDWWDNLEIPVQTLLKERQLRDLGDLWEGPKLPRPDDCLSDDGIRIVCWPVVSRVLSTNEP